jgi:hypothetical protein
MARTACDQFGSVYAKPKTKLEGYKKPSMIWLESGCKISQTREGARTLGINTTTFYKNDLPKLVKSGKMNKNTPFKGTPKSVRTYFNLVGIKQPPNVDVPEELRTKELCQRKFYNNFTLGDMRAMSDKRLGKYFIKARDIQKAWKGQTADEGIKYTGRFPDSTPLFCCDNIGYVSHGRSFYVREGKILGWHEDHNPLYNLAKKAADAWKTNRHSAYRLDIGTINHSIPVIIEVNEIYSSGMSIELHASQSSYSQEDISLAEREAVLCLLARWKDFK